jgi:hypothetical protein
VKLEAERKIGACAEEQVLLRCARPGPSNEIATRLAPMLDGPIDWRHLLALAEAHAMVPLLYSRLGKASDCPAPAEFSERLQGYFRATAAHNLYLTSELIRVLRLFEAEDIRAVPYKGPALATTAYGNLALREFDDLDVLVPKRDVRRAMELLQADRYRPAYDLTRSQEMACLDSQGQIALVHENDACVVELHTELAPKAVAFPIGPRLWDRLQTVSLQGARVKTLSPEDTLLTLSVHGGKHLWTRLRWICDVAMLIAACPDLDWDALLERGAELRVRRMLLVGLALAGDLLETAALFREPIGVRGAFERVAWHLRIRERLRDAARYAVNVVVAPTEADWLLVRLPAPLYPLYYLIRPLRLSAKYARYVWERAVGRGQ